MPRQPFYERSKYPIYNCLPDAGWDGPGRISLDRAFAHSRRVISALLRLDRLDRARKAKIGKTSGDNGPANRWAHTYSKGEWTEMLILLESRSLQLVEDLEGDLIRHYKDVLENDGNRPGRPTAQENYLLYIVLRH